MVYSYATHVLVQFMNIKYILKSHFVNQKLCCGLCVFSSPFSFFVEINGFTILNVEHSNHYINVCLFSSSLHIVLDFTFFPDMWNHAQHNWT